MRKVDQEKNKHNQLYNDESPFMHMDIFKDVVGLSKSELEAIKG